MAGSLAGSNHGDQAAEIRRFHTDENDTENSFFDNNH